MGDDEENEWTSSNITGYDFGDDDQSPYDDLSKYQAQPFSKSLGGQDELFISFDATPGTTSAASSRLVSDRVRAASSAFAAQLDIVERGGLSISDVVGDHQSQSLLSNDPGTLKNELTIARRAVEKISIARFTPLHPKETVKNILLGKPFSLEFYKSFADKVALINEAIACGDGNAILAVVLFLRQTLSRNKLVEVLTSRPSATRHLINYLTNINELTAVADILSGLGRYNEAGLVLYKQALLATDGIHSDSRASKLKSVLSQPQMLRHPDGPYVIEHANLLERLNPVIASDKQNSEIASRLAQAGVPKLDPSCASVLSSLSYCAYFHWQESENLLHSPMAIKKMHKLSDRQYTWTCLLARAKRFQWKDCEDLVVTKGWLGGKKTKASIDPDKVVNALHNYGAPSNILQVYLTMIEDLETRESLAKKVGAHNIVIDLYVLAKDRVALQNYMQKLVPSTTEWHYAENALSVSNTRWKN